MKVRVERNKVLERFAKEDAQTRRGDFAAVLALPEGRRILAWIVHEAAGVYRTFAGDSDALALEAGRRNLGLEILMEARLAAPEAVWESERELETMARKRAEELSLAVAKDAETEREKQQWN